MLNFFPELLFLGRLSPTIIRVAVAIALLYVAYRVLIEAYRVMEVPFPIVGRLPYWMVVLFSTITSIIGVALFLGSWTQPMALLSALLSIKLALGTRWHPDLVFLPLSSALLLFAMSVSLIFTGAGAFAFDLPL